MTRAFSEKFNCTDQPVRALFMNAIVILLLASCTTLEKASLHGFSSGYYKMDTGSKEKQKVYVDVGDESIDVYHQTNDRPEQNPYLNISMVPSDSLFRNPAVFKKNSLDIDITAILLKYRPSVYGLPGQMIADYNMAMYAGRRHDTYRIIGEKDPLGKNTSRIVKRGFDYGVFAGPGATQISPFTTRNNREDEYSGLIVQTGIAAFLESDIASFGIALGVDFLMNSDRTIWIYQKKPWVGFVVGIALN